MENVIDVNEFAGKTVTLKLGKGIFIIKKPSVEEFLVILHKTEGIGWSMENDNKTMIDILCMLVKNKGLFGYRVWYFRRLLRTLDEMSILTIWNKCFLELGVIDPSQAVMIPEDHLQS